MKRLDIPNTKINKSISLKPSFEVKIFLLLFICTTASLQATSAKHGALMINVRYGTLAIVLYLVIHKILNSLPAFRFQKSAFWYVFLFALFLLWGVALSLPFGGYIFFYETPILLAFLLVSMIYGLSIHSLVHNLNDRKSNNPYVDKVLSAYFLISPVVATYLGGISWAIPPRIIFDFGEAIERSYSQGFSGFYSAAAVFFFCKADNQALIWKPVFWILTILFIVLSAVGGARGDFVAGIIAIVLYIVRNPKLGNLLFSSLLVLTTFMVAIKTELADKIIVYQRLIGLTNGDFGMRDTLAAQAFDLLDGNAICMAVGCGFNYFQTYWGYDFGLYPHNSILESILTFGVLIGGGLSLLSLVGVAGSYFGWGARNPLFYLLLVQYIIILKSGSLLDFRSLALILIFAFVGTHSLISSFGHTKRSKIRYES